MRVADIMTREVITVAPQDRVRDAMIVLYGNEIRQVPVVDAHGHLQGIFTDRDLREHLGAAVEGGDPDEPHDRLDDPVESVMTEETVTIAPEADVRALIDLLIKHKFGGAPVLEKGRLVGIVTYIDVLRALRELL